MQRTIERSFALFEKAVAVLLLLGMTVVIATASWSFLRLTAFTALDPATPLAYSAFQAIFDRLLGAVIALELARSVLLLVQGHRGLVQVKIILVIGMLAVVRKLILIELETADAMILIGIALAVVALGVTLALLNHADPKGNEDL